jgi:type IV secretion system protein TrbG
MKRSALPTAALAASLALGACAGNAAIYQAPAPGASPFRAAMLVDGAARPLGPGQPAPLPSAQRAIPATGAGLAPEPVAPRERAGRGASREPAAREGADASQVHIWSEGALYPLVTAPERVSAIALQPGETLVSVAAGDTARWVIGDTSSGSGASRRVHILVKPVAPGLATNLLIATDRRLYHVELESRARGAMAGMSWSYPQDELIALRRAEEEAARAAPVASGIAIEALDFAYRIEGDDPPWRPTLAFDDGQQVFILFPDSLGASEAPPLFVRGAGGRAELVNYRVRGRYYVVDRLFEAAELRLGERRQQVVRIVRAQDGAQRRRRRS